MKQHKVFFFLQLLWTSVTIALLGSIFVPLVSYANPEMEEQQQEQNSEKQQKSNSIEEKGFLEDPSGYVTDGIKDVTEGISDIGKDIKKAGTDLKDTATPDFLKKPEQTNKNIKTIRPEQVQCNYDMGCNIAKVVFFTAKELYQLLDKTALGYIILEKKDLQNPTVMKYYNDIKSLSWAFLMLFLVFHTVRILSIYVVQVEASEVTLLLRRLIIAAILISSQFWLVEKLVGLNEILVKGIINNESVHLLEMSKLFGATDIAFTGGVAMFTLIGLCVFFIFIALLFAFILVQMAIRYAEITLLLIIGPICIATMMNKEYNFFPAWWRHLLAVIFTQAIQILALAIGMALMGEMFVTKNVLQNFLLAIGFFVLVIKVPGLVQEWVKSSGANQGGAFSMAVSTAKNVVKTATGFAKP